MATSRKTTRAAARPPRPRVFNVQRQVQPGAAPGTLVIDPNAPKPSIQVIAYDNSSAEEHDSVDGNDLASWVSRPGVTWINVDGLGDADVLRGLGDVVGLHRLVLEDIVNVHQRAKVEDYGELLFIVARMWTPTGLAEEQISLVVTATAVVSFQERAGDCLDRVRQRIRDGKGRIRGKGTDYLAYAILDAIVDGYFPVLEHYGERLEELEDEVQRQSDQQIVTKLHHIKRELLLLRRTVWQMREMLSTLLRDSTPIVTDNTRVYLRDCYDHAIHVLEILDSYREVASGLVDIHLSLASNRMNEVMKVLTIIATVFIPLTFIAGIYGMNFNSEKSPWNMPELSWYLGYPLCLALMAVTTCGMLLFFRRLGWFGGAGRPQPPGSL